MFEDDVLTSPSPLSPAPLGKSDYRLRPSKLFYRRCLRMSLPKATVSDFAVYTPSRVVTLQSTRRRPYQFVTLYVSTTSLPPRRRLLPPSNAIIIIRQYCCC